MITSNQEFLKLGTLYTVVQIFIHGTRSELLNHITTAAHFLENSSTNNTFLRQLKVKLAGRIALTQLKPIIAT